MMQVNKKIQEKRTLKDYTRLVIGFFIGLLFLGIYQQTRLYIDGVIDVVIGKSLLLLTLNHIGFTALTSLILVFIFKWVEGLKPGFGFKLTILILSTIILAEALLVEYYIRNYELIGVDVFGLSTNTNLSISALLTTILLLVSISTVFYLGYKTTKNFYNMVGKLYPFTIILFTLFLATLFSEKKPINQNKTQYLVNQNLKDVFDFNEYKGEAEFPLLNEVAIETSLNQYFDLKEEKPNLVIILVPGLGSDFINQNGKYNGFTPFLDSLAQKSLVWNNYLSNSTELSAVVPNLIGSLPFGRAGFSNTKKPIQRNTLLGILKTNGYRTSFYYGGNSSLNGLDRFLDEERIDELIDKSQFGTNFKLQEEDGAGISLGYPDKELFRKWEELYIPLEQPKFEIFLTLSSKTPFAVPDIDRYGAEVNGIIEKSNFSRRDKKLAKKNNEAFASILYTDDALKSLFGNFQLTKEFNNTIYVISGTGNMGSLPKDSDLEKYRTPLIIYSPLLTKKAQFNVLASHLDLVPSLISLLSSKYELKVPVQTAWLGNNLLKDDGKEIPLLYRKNNIKEYIIGNTFYNDGKVHQLDSDLNLLPLEDNELSKLVEHKYNYFKAVNKYVTQKNKLIPDSIAIYDIGKHEFSKQDLVWVNSVFNGKDYDNAYSTARSLAHDGKADRALLLVNYILAKVPGHIDALILKGRIFAWQKQYTKAQDILEMAVRKFPKYHDAYSALLDVYYWSNNDILAQNIYKKIRANDLETPELRKKLERCISKINTENIGARSMANLEFEDW